MSNFIQKQAVIIRARATKPIQVVDGADLAYQQRRAEIALLKVWAQKYPDVIRQLAKDLGISK